MSNIHGAGDTSDPKIKEALKEALYEWMDDKFALLGKWTAGSIAVAMLGAIVWFILTMEGWHK